MTRLRLITLIALLLFLSSCEKLAELVTEENPQRYLILYTNDEHGHIWEPDGREKAAILDEMWREEERACEGCVVIRVSGGDNYTGSAISSIFKGRSAAEAMREIGYQIAAVGNHEFDYGMAEFEENRTASKIKYLSANIIGKGTKSAFPASHIIEREGSRIAFIGVTTEELRQVSFSANLKDLKTVQALNAVQREIRRLKGEADTVIVIAHQSFESSREWAALLEPEDRPLVVFNAHTHDEYVRDAEGIYFVQALKYMEKYARVEILRRKGKFSVADARIVTLRDEAQKVSPEGSKVRETVAGYLAKMDRLAGATVMNAENDLAPDRFMRLYACAVLDDFPDADVALSNPDAFRDKIRSGPIRVSDIISMMPFENRLVVSTIPGKDLVYNLNLSEKAVCGMEKVNDRWFKAGMPLDPSQEYRAVIHEYIYAGGDYYKFLGPGITNQMTSKIWRAPIIRYLGEKGREGKTLDMSYDELMKKYGYK